MWIDSHCHVTADEFAEDRAAVLERAAAAGVEAFVAIGAGYGVEHNALAVELAQSDPRVFATAGLHPHDARPAANGNSALCRHGLDSLRERHGVALEVRNPPRTSRATGRARRTGSPHTPQQRPRPPL